MHGCSILLIDDDRDATEMMRVLLTNAGFKGALRTFHDAAAALAYLDGAVITSALPQLIVVDLSLPGMHGFEVVREIRQRLRGARAYILVVSGSDHDDDIHAAFSVGADAYFEKFPSVEALRRVREAFVDGSSIPCDIRVLLKARKPARRRASGTDASGQGAS